MNQMLYYSGLMLDSTNHLWINSGIRCNGAVRWKKYADRIERLLKIGDTILTIKDGIITRMIDDINTQLSLSVQVKDMRLIRIDGDKLELMVLDTNGNVRLVGIDTNNRATISSPIASDIEEIHSGLGQICLFVSRSKRVHTLDHSQFQTKHGSYIEIMNPIIIKGEMIVTSNGGVYQLNSNLIVTQFNLPFRTVDCMAAHGRHLLLENGDIWSRKSYPDSQVVIDRLELNDIRWKRLIHLVDSNDPLLEDVGGNIYSMNENNELTLRRFPFKL